MKIHNLFYFLVIFASSQTLAQSSLPSVTQLQAWFKKPGPLPPWRYLATEKLHTLVANSDELGGNHLWYRPAGSTCVVSVPHQFFDKNTLPIGQAVFAQMCQLLVSNSHHRNHQDEHQESMDLSKRHNNLHHNAILAYQANFKDAKVFQLHGFSQSKRSTDKGKLADFIVSQGRRSTPKLQRLASCLTALSPHSFYYPEQISELGGTKNVLHQLPLIPHSFYHIEISAIMRQRLTKESQLMEQFILCLQSIR
ncbi:MULTISPECIES: hypothetical protein [Pseudoalteromonas]|uniref:Uncharacterized protein n=1 Tax=Pseudoalteromonas amylolytica TaxID=1859457 RepID=A0A1S1MTK9_9GAMM|nr:MULTISPECIES: hypothetical protein [Pseudoalteromonas]OHU89304.1 hypothetical protein BFC16_06650 [Pseudoalteromonas sp. JW3]OHU92204.1 hypothetical protein BET10_07755 [Pseudoalteromonas amylolytica]